MLLRLIKTAILFCVIALGTIVSTHAQNNGGKKIDIKIYFPYDEAYIDSSYMGNSEILDLVDSLITDTAYIATISQIEVAAQSSPEGTVSYNSRLSERRRVTLKKYFTEKYPNIEPSLWSFTAVAENWELFHQHLVDDPNLPNRQEVLSISSSKLEADYKEWLLRTMYDGKTWEYIKEHILPDHRFGASILFIPITKEPILPQPITLASEDRVPPASLPRYSAPTQEDQHRALIAIKSNLVLDALSVVNLGVEVPIGNRFSVVGEVVYPWWRSWPGNLTMQIESYHGELKYWLGERSQENQLTGWSAGIYGGWGLYDIQPFSEEGVQGDFYDIGAQICYSHSIAKNLHLEYSLGLGYVSTDYNDYYMAYDTAEYGDIKVIPYPWMNHRLRSILPTRLGVSLVWHINPRWKGGKR